MSLDYKSITWKNMDIPLIENAYKKVSEIVSLEQCNTETMNKIKSLMETYLPMYRIKCDEENNPPEVIYSGHIRARVMMDTFLSGSYNYVDVIF